MHIEVFGNGVLPIGFRVESETDREQRFAEAEAHREQERARWCHQRRGVFVCEERWDLCAALVGPRAARARVERNALYLGTVAPDWAAGAAEHTHQGAVAEIGRLEQRLAQHDRSCLSCRV